MNINEVYRFVNYVANKEQRGYLKPSDFNLQAKIAQLDFLSKRLGNIKLGAVPPFGYKSTRKIDIDLRPLVYGPITIPIASNGNFNYPAGFIWPDAVHKNDYNEIRDVDSDEYPRVKNSSIYPPTSESPVIVYRNPYGFIDPYSIGSFGMSYLKAPADPVWGYTGDPPVYDPATSVDFSVNPYTNAHLEICMIILQNVGVNLDSATLLQYSKMKEDTTS